MAKLIYFMPTSLDGYIADETGNPDWATADEEVFAFINDLVRLIGMYLYGRKIHEPMAIWETPNGIPGLTPSMLDFARIWQAADKILFGIVPGVAFCLGGRMWVIRLVFGLFHRSGGGIE